MAAEHMIAEHTAADQTAADQTAADQTAAEHGAAEHGAAEHAAVATASTLARGGRGNDAGGDGRPPRRRSRREEILEIAVGLFAARGYHGVSVDDIGAAAGVTGPALYHHFAGKEAMLAAALNPVSEGLLAGGRTRVEGAREPYAALVALVNFHVDFALNNPAVIALHLHELDRLPDEPRREIRRLQRLYVEEWVRVLMALRDELAAPEARVLAHAAFGLMNSTLFLSGEVDRSRCADLLRAATLAALQG